jgi:radical SAM superfamily enzyme YgiQ (UPF0313 family)
MLVLLVSTYELGRPPFGLASPAAWLRRASHEVVCLDLGLGRIPWDLVSQAGCIAFYLPMHTATRLALPLIEQVRKRAPDALLSCYGLYAPLNEAHLRALGVTLVLGGEFEAELVRAVNDGNRKETLISLERLQFCLPDRSGFAPLSAYAKLRLNGYAKLAGYTEASRGCKHLCRHCPVVPVYQGKFRVIQPEVVLADIRQQVLAGATHITFGDPDFFNGPTHAVRIVETFHREFPAVTYDATIKIEHLRRHRDLLPVLKRTGCLFVTSAVESVDDAVLEKLDKGHTRADFLAVIDDFRNFGLNLAPTFIPFTPWTSLDGYRELLALLAENELIENVSPVQLALRLLIPPGSLLLDLPDIQAVLTGFDAPGLRYLWRHPDPAVDQLAASALKVAGSNGSRSDLFAAMWELVYDHPLPKQYDRIGRAAIPYLDEPWYC